MSRQFSCYCYYCSEIGHQPAVHRQIRTDAESAVCISLTLCASVYRCVTAVHTVEQTGQTASIRVFSSGEGVSSKITGRFFQRGWHPLRRDKVKRHLAGECQRTPVFCLTHTQHLSTPAIEPLKILACPLVWPADNIIILTVLPLSLWRRCQAVGARV
ncbi:hypothetical protein LSH36_657g01053 [Paralvinella palmiformis]|uniref:Uncharacterized protein n=1 Tax=Paralvinella palmiformis TaxID=53620 RepID=A0AAD9J539_9ANNE|nr:hypothetical protein LSH36_657g01053 [Paralvinella palmiformis]